MMQDAHEISKCMEELERAGYRFAEEVGGKFMFERKSLFEDRVESIAAIDLSKGRIAYCQKIQGELK